MVSADDPKGHYHALGLAPNASHAQITHAYREWAKAFHPDVTGSTDTGDFLRIKEAYDTLSDSKRRHLYDVASHHATWVFEPPEAGAPPAHPAAHTAAHSRHEAIRCSECNAISAQPRWCVFDRVICAIVYCRLDRLQGIYCRRCAARKALRCSMTSWLCGWWGVGGIFRTPVALWHNFRLGSKPHDLNARLLISQAEYFIGIKNELLADACLQQAAQFAEGADAEALHRLQHSLTTDVTITIRDEWAVYRHPLAFGHFLPLLVLIAIVVSYTMMTPAKSRASKPVAVASVSHSSESWPARADDVRHVANDSATMWVVVDGAYVSAGYLPRYTTVKVVGLTSNPQFVSVLLPDGHNAIVAESALAAGNGQAARLLLCNDLTQQPTRNGEIFRQTQSGPNHTIITNSGSDAAVVKFRNPAGSVVVAMFVDGHSQAFVDNFPDGSYQFEYATGMRWNRKCGFFEQDMSAQRLPAFDAFASWLGVEIKQGKHVAVAHTGTATYTIPAGPDGEAQPQAIDQDAFTHD